MTSKDLESIDLNLLLSLQALLHYKHVTLAAESLNLTQSGMSRSLAKLRGIFNDDLLIRSGRGMSLSTRAESLVDPLDEILRNVSNFISPPSFDPSQHTFHLRIAAVDFFVQWVLPTLLNRLGESTQETTVEVVNWDKDTQLQLEQGELDLAFGGLNEAKTGIYQSKISENHYVCIARKGHPVLGKGLSLQQFCRVPHVMTTLEGRGSSPLDKALADLGMSRHVAVKVNSFIGAVSITAQTDNVMVISKDIALLLADAYPIQIYNLPLKLEMPNSCMFWHRRTHKDPSYQWLRSFLMNHIKNLVS